jgi:hypothetical protein
MGPCLGVTMIMMTWRRALRGMGRGRPVGGSARRGAMVVVAAGTALVCAGLLTVAGSASAAAVRAGAPGVGWGTAEEVPGLAALNTGGYASVTSVSCWAVNNCASGGYYGYSDTLTPHGQAFVVAEQNGRWGKAEEVPGLAALNTGGDARVVSVSCAPGGYCVAGGYYADGDGNSQAFVVTAVKGRWRAAVEVPGTAALEAGGGFARVTSVSCPAAGSCAAGGYYANGKRMERAFVVSQKKGSWHAARRVPVPVAGPGGDGFASLSCWSAGNCAAGGSYSASGRLGAWVVSERNGVWGRWGQVPGLAALNTGHAASVNSVSCARGGYCAVGGFYRLPAAGPDSPAYDSPFVASGRNGRWHAAVAWPAAPVLNGFLGPDDGDIVAVSCPSPRSCVAAGFDGYYADGQPPFVVSQKNGVWGTPRALPGALATPEVFWLSCPSAGNCGIGGGNLVVGERNGRWAKAEKLPGLAALGKIGGGTASIVSVSCPSAGHCTAAGFYGYRGAASKSDQAFVTGPK